MAERGKKRRNRLLTAVFSFIVIAAIGLVILLMLSLMNSGGLNDQDTYRGPPLDNAIYEEAAQYTITGERGEKRIEVDSGWIGIKIKAEYASACDGTIECVAPSGIMLTSPFQFSLTEKEILNDVENTVGEHVISLEPGIWDVEIFGKWTFNYDISGGPVKITIYKVVSWGTPE